MRKELVVILALLFGGALVAYRWIGMSPLVFYSARGVASIDNSGSPTAAAAQKGPAARNKATTAGSRVIVTEGNSGPIPQSSFAQTEAAGLAALPAEDTPSTAPCCGRTDLPFPTPETVRKGSSQAEIRAAFGAPAMDIAGTREKRVFERYYYINEVRSRLTVVNFENGVLVSVEGLSKPYFQLPNR